MTMKAHKFGKHKRIITDSTESESDDHESKIPSRKSSRISQKQNKTKFQLPSRDDIWKDIPTLQGNCSLKRLTPKKSVNDFTKVFNKYNFDDYEDTSDSMSSTESLSEEEEMNSKKHDRKHRIRHRYSRITQVDSSDEEQKSDIPSPQQPGTTPKDPDKDVQTNEDTLNNIASQSFEGSLEEDKSEDSNESTTAAPKRLKKKRYSFPDSEEEKGD